MTSRIRIGTAGWSVPAPNAADFPAEGSHLERYAARFDAVEINSSFHRPHRRATYARWAASVPDDFRFSAKLPRTITHDRRLIDCDEPLRRFADEISGLGDKLGVLLVQLPPTLLFEADVVSAFFAALRSLSDAALACEPRHDSWFAEDAGAALAAMKIARVAADPARTPAAALPGGSPLLRYVRLHGSPVIYRSAYGEERLRAYAAMLHAAGGADSWCIFDNTASMAATGDALLLQRIVAP